MTHVPATESLLGLALEHQQAGRLGEADQLYHHLVNIAPYSAEAWYRYGLLAWQCRRLDDALACFERATALEPAQAIYSLHRAQLLHACGRNADALALFRALVEANPALAEAHFGLGQALRVAGQTAAAEAHQQLAVQANRDAELWNSWGCFWEFCGCWPEALACYDQAVRLEPRLAAALSNLGNALKWLGRPAEAIPHYEAALRAKPGFTEVHVNLASVLHDLGRFDEAIEMLGQVIQQRSDLPEAHCNLGHTFEHVGQLPRAIACYQEAIRLRPDYVQAHWNLALAWLATGDWKRGWPEFEWRWQKAGMFPLRSPLPRWDGSPLQGRRILLYDEQGLGDTLQFVRYAALVKQRGGKVLVRCQRPLMCLLACTPSIDQLVARDEPLPPFDVHAPLLSLPGILGTTPEAVPSHVPYLHIDPERAQRLESGLAPEGEFRVGIVWKGNAEQATERFRSVPLEQFARLAQIPDVRLFSLQKHPGTDRASFPLVDLSDRLSDFQETAAVVANLDLVVTRDTAVAHLAGGLGKPVWVALSAVPDWRWMRDRPDSPWYPTMSLFRQHQLGRWDDVFESIAARLHAQILERERPRV